MNENENTTPQNLWDVAKAVLRWNSYVGLLQETRTISNKQLNFTPKVTRKRTHNTQTKQKKRNNKDYS